MATTVVRLIVNGQQHEIEAAEEMPLLYLLRNDLGLNAAKYGCGFGKCGACTVLLDGDAVLACRIPVGELTGREVTTLEGLAPGDALHPLQEAFIDEQAAQCGYCTPGIIVSAAALLARTPKPADEELRAALASSLCRCGSHQRILRAIRRVIDHE
jgi:nicotinate dehydrogenase subunit A